MSQGVIKRWWIKFGLASLAIVTLALVVWRATIARRFVCFTGKNELRAAARELRAATEQGGAGREFPRERWPKALVQASVLTIRPYFDGIQIVLRRSVGGESGVFVAAVTSRVPEQGSGIEFNLMSPGIYEFSEKLREPYTGAK
jgi:hypothetical protein